MAHLYIALGIDPEKILPGTPHKTQSELWDSDGIWTYVEYEAQRRTTEDVTIVYKVFVDWTLTNPYNESGKQKAAKLRADYGFNPLKTVEETITLEKVNRNAISGNDMSSSGNNYDMAPMSIDPKYATAYAANDAYERMISRWLNRHKEQISTLVSDIISISQGVAEGKAAYYAKTAEELIDMAKGTKELVEINKTMYELQRSIQSLKSELEPVVQNLERINKETQQLINNVGKGGAESDSLAKLISQADEASKMASETDRMIFQPVKPVNAQGSKLPSPALDVQIENTLRSSAQKAISEVASTAGSEPRLATKGELLFAEAGHALNKSASNLEPIAGTAQESSKALGPAVKWLKRAGYVGLALQAGCVLLNGIFVLLAEEGNERNSAMQTFGDSAGSFGISLGMYLGAAAIGGPVGLAIGIGLAVIDIALLATTGKSSADYIWGFVKYTVNCDLNRRQLELDIKRGYHIGVDTHFNI